ncbi:hypothetical protein [Planococcus antarcticus]|uniref:hypothetical protein n=1 Tax=Planococcus antarcticus TaxID=161360 RepID=UPI0012B5A103|nr:hypothetical protein [Planococcus antarcticus]
MQNKSYSYTEERFRMYQLAILQQAGDQQAVESFCMKHHRYPEIRKAQVLQTLDAGEFEKAIRCVPNRNNWM